MISLRSTRLCAATRIAAALVAALTLSLTARAQAVPVTGAQGSPANTLKVRVIGPFTGSSALSFPFFIEGAKEAAEGALMAQTFIAEPGNERRASFLSGYARKYQVKKMPVPMAAQGYDAVYVLVYSLFGIRDGKLTGPAIKAALQSRNRTYYGVTATYEQPFSLQDKDATIQNMLVRGMVRNSTAIFAYPEDAKRNLFVQRKQ